MKMNLLQLLFRGSLFGLVLASSSGQTLQNSKIIKTSLEKKGVTVEVSLPDAVSAGQPVEMIVNVANTGPESIIYMDWIDALGIHLVDSNKVAPEMTPLGKDSIDVRNWWSAPPVVMMKPGEHREWRVDLETLFILKPGKYQVSLKPKLVQITPERRVSLNISTDPLGFSVQ